MGKKAWIAFAIICVVIIAIVLVLMIVLVPQVKSSGGMVDEYVSIAKQDYAFSGQTQSTLKQEYNVTSKDVSDGLKNNKYEEGNINPFTPKAEVTIYNEPTLNNNSSGLGTLTPDSK